MIGSPPNIKKGDSYVEALMNQNGFLDKASLQRFIVANANPEFMEELGLTEAQAVSYVGNVDLTNFKGLSADYAQQLQNVISETITEIQINGNLYHIQSILSIAF